MISSTKVDAPAIRTPGITSATPISRRMAHCEHKVTEAFDSGARSVASNSASGAAYGSSKVSARPGKANHDASPLSQSDVFTPEASAVAATVKA